MKSKRVLIARPRLDCSFKKGPVPDVERPPTDPLRQLWAKFIDGLAEYHSRSGCDVHIETRPLWAFDVDALRMQAQPYDVVYFPHRQKADFDLGPNALYYKPSAFPELFTVDPLGWGASASFSPLGGSYSDAAEICFEQMRQRISTNTSKFPQPQWGGLPLQPGYSLFVCQVPHDENVMQHSSVSVEDALQAVLHYCSARGIPLLVKGHPANAKAMAPLKEMVRSSPAAWVDSASIHECLAGAGRVYLVNSGVGFEALLHVKPVTAFGRAEYSAVVSNAEATDESIDQAASRPLDRRAYAACIAAYVDACVDVHRASTFSKVEAIARKLASA
jgi:hypothetical protein